MADLLYVVCHGLISLVRKKDGSFRAVMIKMPDHVYLAGTWLNERPIGPGVFKLTGVKGKGVVLPKAMAGPDRLDPAKNVVIPGVEIPDLDASVRTIIDLPVPAAIHSYGQVDVSALLTGPAEALSKVGRTMSATRVFVYEISGETKNVKLGSHPWRAFVGRRSKPGVAVLHLCNEPNDQMLLKTPAEQKAHNVTEFAKSAKMLGSKLAISTPASAPPAIAGSLLPGLASLELEPLIHREQTVRQVAEAVLTPDANPQGTAAAACLGADGDGRG